MNDNSDDRQPSTADIKTAFDSLFGTGNDSPKDGDIEAIRASIAAQIQADVAELIGHVYPTETVLAALDGAAQMTAHAAEQIAEGKEVAVRIQGAGGAIAVPVGLSCAVGSKPIAPGHVLDALLSRLVLSPSTVLVLGAHGYGMTLVSKKPKSRLVIEQA